MSLGWQCESALLPSKSKPINVDGKSMVGLKALLYNEEQNKTGTGSSQRIQRKSKPLDSSRSASDRPAAKDSEHGASTGSTHDKETAAYRALQAKAKLYDEINNGKSLLQSDLIDFGNKTTESQTQDVKPKETSVPAVPPPRPPPFKNPSASQPASHVNTSNIMSYNTIPSEQAAVSTQPQWNWSTTYATSKASSSDAYALNTGTSAASNNADNTNSYLSQVAAERELKQVINERVQEEHQSSLATVSDGARVKTQWEKTLNSSARGFLDEIHDEVAVQREVAGLTHSAVGRNNEAGQKRSAKEAKLELIRQKRLKL